MFYLKTRINLVKLINQSFQKFEIIITNDNSNDNTETIIKKYQLIN